MKKLLIFFCLFAVACSSPRLLSDGHEASAEHLNEHANAVHVHADFKVYIRNEPVDFSVRMYQLRASSVHVENGIGEVMHVHQKGITMGDFLETLDIGFNKTCISIPIEGSFCYNEKEDLRFFVNSVANNDYEDYEIKEGDMILISYGKEGDLAEQIISVTELSSQS